MHKYLIICKLSLVSTKIVLISSIMVFCSLKSWKFIVRSMNQTLLHYG